jgi:hypothetical protein
VWVFVWAGITTVVLDFHEHQTTRLEDRSPYSCELDVCTSNQIGPRDLLAGIEDAWKDVRRMGGRCRFVHASHLHWVAFSGHVTAVHGRHLLIVCFGYKYSFSKWTPVLEYFYCIDALIGWPFCGHPSSRPGSGLCSDHMHPAIECPIIPRSRMFLAARCFDVSSETCGGEAVEALSVSWLYFRLGKNLLRPTSTRQFP